MNEIIPKKENNSVNIINNKDAPSKYWTMPLRKKVTKMINKI